MKKEIYNALKEKIGNIEILLNGGKGSGNFGHSGRPGQIGGSGDGGTSLPEKLQEDYDEKKKAYEAAEKN